MVIEIFIKYPRGPTCIKGAGVLCSALIRGCITLILIIASAVRSISSVQRSINKYNRALPAVCCININTVRSII